MRFTRGVGIVLSGAVMAAGLVTATAGSASAADGCGDSYTVYGEYDVVAGYVWWNANPDSCQNGDNLGAQDVLTDGYSVVAHLAKLDFSVPNRVVSTSGYTAPHIAWKGGNLPEGDQYYLWGCLSKDGIESNCTIWYLVTA